MKILYKNVDIYGKDGISLNYAVHEMHAGKESDSLVLRFNDSQGLWSRWNPKNGDEIALEHKKSVTGKMFIHELSANNGIFTIRAMSMPLTMKDPRSASWQSITLLQIANEIATRHGLTLKAYNVKDQVYKDIRQIDESDAAFLSKLCMLESCQMLIFDGAIIIYDEIANEHRRAGGTIEINSGKYSFTDNSGEALGAVKVCAGFYSGEFMAGEGKRKFETTLKCNSSVEAKRFAAGILRDSNKSLKAGSAVLDFTSDYAPASVVDIKVKKAVQWSGKSVISKIRQDYVKNLTTLFFRSVYLEGY